MKKLILVPILAAFSVAVHSQIISLPKPLTYFKQALWGDTISGTANVNSHYYPYYNFPNPASGDGVSFGPFRPFQIGNAQYNVGTANIQNDPILLMLCYNKRVTASDLIVANEPGFSLNLEAGYNPTPADFTTRQMEFYATFCKKDGSGTEKRVFGWDYRPSSDEITGASVMATSANYSRRFTINSPTGGSSGTAFATFGWGPSCGFTLAGDSTTDNTIKIDSAGSRAAALWIGYGTTSGAAKMYTASANTTRVDVGSSSNGFQWSYNDGGMSVGINNTGNLNGLSVKPMSNAYATIRGYSLSGQTLPAFQAWGSGGAQTAGMYAENGAILSKSTGGVGYEAGAGGTVTQTGFRTSGVTINKTTGAITLVSASGSTTPTTFTVTNSTVAATDVIVLNQKSGTDLYVLLVTNVGSGTFKITAYTTGGTTSEQPVINFAVIKGASS